MFYSNIMELISAYRNGEIEANEYPVVLDMEEGAIYVKRIDNDANTIYDMDNVDLLSQYHEDYIF